MDIKASLGKVLPHHGISTILFGISRQDLKDVLGEPSNISNEKTVEADEDELPDVVIDYEDLGLSFAFDPDYSYRLSHIESSREDVEFLDINLFDEPLDIIVSNLAKYSISEISEVEQEDGQIQHYFDIEDYSVTLWFLNGVFEHIGWFCEYDDNEEKPIWPAMN